MIESEELELRPFGPDMTLELSLNLPHLYFIYNVVLSDPLVQFGLNRESTHRQEPSSSCDDRCREDQSRREAVVLEDGRTDRWAKESRNRDDSIEHSNPSPNFSLVCRELSDNHGLASEESPTRKAVEACYQEEGGSDGASGQMDRCYGRVDDDGACDGREDQDVESPERIANQSRDDSSD